MAHPNYADTRQLFLRNTLTALAQQYTPDQLKQAEAAIKEHIANTYTDEVLFQDFNRIAAEKRAKEAAYWNEYYAADAAKKAQAKIKRDHQDHLDREKAKLAEQIEEAETWEKRAETLEGQLSALMKRQGK
jgi:hypothetical protein